jgi:ribosomal protein S18 acetylase RimI-like enzyme
MSDVALKFAYRVSGAEGLDDIRPLWEKLRAHYSPFLSPFGHETPPFIFEPRKQEIVAKAAPGKTRVELVSIVSEAVDIAYCVSTVSPSGRGELDSMFVEERCRGRGIGSELVRHALAWMESAEASSKVVTVAYANERVLAFYRRFGFHARAILLQQINETPRGAIA